MKKQILTLPLIFGALLLGTAHSANATAAYQVSVNTSSLSGTTGSLDFQFNPGVGVSQSATVQASGFTGGTYGGTQQLFGGATGGPIPSSISITNSGADNEAFDTFTFGNSLVFNLLFSGPAITAPTGLDTAGSTFAFYIYTDAAGTQSALTTNPNGYDLLVNVSPDGVVTSSVLSPQVQLTPEPSSAALLGGSLVLVAFGLFRRRRLAN